MQISESSIKRSPGVFSPDSSAKGVWDISCFFFVFYQSIVVPYRICFEVEA